jgi:hypothetical protein
VRHAPMISSACQLRAPAGRGPLRSGDDSAASKDVSEGAMSIWLPASPWPVGSGGYADAARSNALCNGSLNTSMHAATLVAAAALGACMHAGLRGLHDWACGLSKGSNKNQSMPCTSILCEYFWSVLLEDKHMNRQLGKAGAANTFGYIFG